MGLIKKYLSLIAVGLAGMVSAGGLTFFLTTCEVVKSATEAADKVYHVTEETES
jgi:hypothetical protein